uniref:DDE_3 domain-containing protein n=1 Tax=Macrostomum lignano TaxID=282301 RepID=A0A1I8HUP2_9PLAT
AMLQVWAAPLPYRPYLLPQKHWEAYWTPKRRRTAATCWPRKGRALGVRGLAVASVAVAAPALGPDLQAGVLVAIVGAPLDAAVYVNFAGAEERQVLTLANASSVNVLVPDAATQLLLVGVALHGALGVGVFAVAAVLVAAPALLTDRDRRVAIHVQFRLGSSAAAAFRRCSMVYECFRCGSATLDDDPRKGRPELLLDSRRTFCCCSTTRGRRLASNDSLVGAARRGHLGMRKLSVRWVLHQLSADQMRARVEFADLMVARFDGGRSKLVNNILTGDETWAYFYDPETKSRIGSGSPTRGRCSSQISSLKRSVGKGFLPPVLLQQGATVTAEWYSTVCLPQVLQALAQQRPKTLDKGMFLHQDNAPVHRARVTQEFFQATQLVQLPHPAYLPDLASADFFPFPRLKKSLKGKRLDSREELVVALQAELDSFTKANLRVLRLMVPAPEEVLRFVWKHTKRPMTERHANDSPPIEVLKMVLAQSPPHITSDWPPQALLHLSELRGPYLPNWLPHQHSIEFCRPANANPFFSHIITQDFTVMSPALAALTGLRLVAAALHVAVVGVGALAVGAVFVTASTLVAVLDAKVKEAVESAIGPVDVVTPCAAADLCLVAAALHVALRLIGSAVQIVTVAAEALRGVLHTGIVVAQILAVLEAEVHADRAANGQPSQVPGWLIHEAALRDLLRIATAAKVALCGRSVLAVAVAAKALDASLQCGVLGAQQNFARISLRMRSHLPLSPPPSITSGAFVVGASVDGTSGACKRELCSDDKPLTASNARGVDVIQPGVSASLLFVALTRFLTAHILNLAVPVVLVSTKAMVAVLHSEVLVAVAPAGLATVVEGDRAGLCQERQISHRFVVKAAKALEYDCRLGMFHYQTMRRVDAVTPSTAANLSPVTRAPGVAIRVRSLAVPTIFVTAEAIGGGLSSCIFEAEVSAAALGALAVLAEVVAAEAAGGLQTKVPIAEPSADPAAVVNINSAEESSLRQVALSSVFEAAKIPHFCGDAQCKASAILQLASVPLPYRPLVDEVAPGAAADLLFVNRARRGAVGVQSFAVLAVALAAEAVRSSLQSGVLVAQVAASLHAAVDVGGAGAVEGQVSVARLLTDGESSGVDAVVPSTTADLFLVGSALGGAFRIRALTIAAVPIAAEAIAGRLDAGVSLPPWSDLAKRRLPRGRAGERTACTVMRIRLCTTSVFGALLLAACIAGTGAQNNGKCPAGWVGRENSSWCYEFASSNGNYKSWDDAKLACEVQHGTLLAMADVSEREWVARRVNGFQSGSSWWLGLERTTGVWRWVDNRSGGETPGNSPEDGRVLPGNCMSIRVDGTKSEILYVYPRSCNKMAAYICKKQKQDATTCDADDGWETHGDRCYKAFNSDNNGAYWEDARDHCNRIESDLVIVNDATTSQIVRDIVNRGGPGAITNTFWIGLRSVQTGSNPDQYSWRWVDNSPAIYKAWTNGEEPQAQKGLCVHTEGTDSSQLWRAYGCNGRRFGFVCSRPTGTCATGWYQHRDTCYSLNPTQLSWTQASDHCQSYGATLLRIKQDHVQKFINMYREDFARNGIEYIWMGMYRAVSESGEIKWTSGDPVSSGYTNWANGQPQLDDGRANAGRVIAIDDGGRWQIANPTAKGGFVCEIPLGKTPLVPTTVYPSFVCEQGWILYGSRCYKLESNKFVDWLTARANCQAFPGADLIDIRGRSEQEFIQKQLDPRRDYWIGLHTRSTEDRSWVWVVDNSPMDYQNWQKGEPNNLEKEENCVEMYTSGTWNDNRCTYRLSYICKVLANVNGSPRPTLPGTTTPNFDPFCGPLWRRDPTSNYCYLFNTDPLIWFDAKHQCEFQGGKLASIVTQEEKAYIAARIKTMKDEDSGILGFWLGFNDRAEEGYWVWDDGEPVTFLNWAAGEPNNAGAGEDCGMIYADSAMWNDFACEKRYASICKKLGNVLITIEPPPATTIEVPDGYLRGCRDGYSVHNNMCYKVFTSRDDEMTWYDAKARCQLEGGDLASVMNLAEQQFLQELAVPRDFSYWIGLYDSLAIDRMMYFKWSDTSKPKFTYWFKNEPNNYLKKDDCVEIVNMWDGWNGRWNDQNCDYKRRFACKQRQKPVLVLPPVTKPPGCPEGYDGAYGGQCLKFVTGTTLMTATAAKAACQADGGFLASIPTEDVQNHIFLRLTELRQTSNYWIGLVRSGLSF